MLFKIKRIEDENEIDYLRRKKFITKMGAKNKKEFEYYEMLSKILNNILLLKCQYIPELQEKILKICLENTNINCN